MAILIGIAVASLILSAGTWIGARIWSKDVPFTLCLITAAITVVVSLIPGVGFVLGTVAYLVCLVTIVQLDFWPEAVVVWFVVRAINFALGMVLAGLFR
ncbi:MAG: hypothetical protein WCT04_10965 [Planctomycetota bacterium]